ncbi:MAG: hypothetical protein L6R48_02460 [Planctomycetes bacterium]|nr:hypothetical protein [Planctomycetota bacterium]
MASTRRSWYCAALAGLLGLGLWCFDDLYHWLLPEDHWGVYVAGGFELLLMGPGLAAAAFMASELLARRVAEERTRRFSALGVVSASVAHEVRNPLHNLRLLLDEAVAEGTLAGDGELHQRLAANVERIRQAVDLVYCLARTEPQAAPAEPCDLVELLGECLAAEAAQGRPLPLTLPAGPAPVAVEPALVRLVLGNLLRNARAALVGDAAVAVRLEREPAAWLLELANPGRLPPDAGRGPLGSAKPDGLGLGLFISRQLAESVRGSLEMCGRDGLVVARLRLPRNSR